MGVALSTLCRGEYACAFLVAIALQLVQGLGEPRCQWLSDAPAGTPACAISASKAPDEFAALVARADECLQSTVTSPVSSHLRGCSAHALHHSSCRSIPLQHGVVNYNSSICGPASLPDEAASALALLHRSGSTRSPDFERLTAPPTPPATRYTTAWAVLWHLHSSTQHADSSGCCGDARACSALTTPAACVEAQACSLCAEAAAVAGVTDGQSSPTQPQATMHEASAEQLDVRAERSAGRQLFGALAGTSNGSPAAAAGRSAEERRLSGVPGGEVTGAVHRQWSELHGAMPQGTVKGDDKDREFQVKRVGGGRMAAPGRGLLEVEEELGDESGGGSQEPGGPADGAPPQAAAADGAGGDVATGGAPGLNRWLLGVVAALGTLAVGLLATALLCVLRRRKTQPSEGEVAINWREQGRLHSVYGDTADLPSVVHMDPVHKGTALATAHSIHAVASRDTSNEYLLGGRMGSGGVAVVRAHSGHFVPPHGPYSHRGPALPAPAVLSPTTPTFWPGAPAGCHSGRRSLSRSSTGSARAAQCELAVSTAGASTVSPCPSASVAPARGGLAPYPRGGSSGQSDGEGGSAPTVLPPSARRKRSGGSGTRGHTFVETCSIGTPRQPPGPEDSLHAKMDYIHFQLDSFGANREILYGVILLGAGTLYRFQGGQAIVQIARNRHSGQEVAMKFFAVRSAFDAESALYLDSGNPLGAFLPKLQALIDNAEGEIVDPHGAPMPPCIVMEKGEALDVWCDRRKPDLGQAYVVIQHIAKRLADLHAAGYAHRDLKPSNVMWLPRENRWTLIDFGCAARIGQAATMGFSPVYAAPEVIQAVRAGHRQILVTPALDAWSLGVLSMELLCGFSLLDTSGGLEKAMCQIAGEGGERLPWEDRESAPRIIGALGALKRHILQLVSRDPAQRPSMPEFGRVCNRLLHSTASVSPPT
eukprot:jgi/Ulvmu1/12595/UM092_0025.1